MFNNLSESKFHIIHRDIVSQYIPWGIDVSHHQGKIDWETAKHFVGFVIIRMGYGNHNMDREAIANATACEELGIPYGFYWFSYALNEEDARNEARYLDEEIRSHGFKPNYPLYYDFEYGGLNHAKKYGISMTKKTVTAMANAFCSELEALGYYTGIYTNLDFYKNWYEKSIWKKFDMWYTHPKKRLKYAGLWQIDDKGRIDGIDTNVDRNKAYKNYPYIMKVKHLNGF